MIIINKRDQKKKLIEKSLSENESVFFFCQNDLDVSFDDFEINENVFHFHCLE